MKDLRDVATAPRGARLNCPGAPTASPRGRKTSPAFGRRDRGSPAAPPGAGGAARPLLRRAFSLPGAPRWFRRLSGIAPPPRAAWREGRRSPDAGYGPARSRDAPALPAGPGFPFPKPRKPPSVDARDGAEPIAQPLNDPTQHLFDFSGDEGPPGVLKHEVHRHAHLSGRHRPAPVPIEEGHPHQGDALDA